MLPGSSAVMTFDKVDYDISVALFDAAGELHGVARAPCPVRRFGRARC